MREIYQKKSANISEKQSLISKQSKKKYGARFEVTKPRRAFALYIMLNRPAEGDLHWKRTLAETWNKFNAHDKKYFENLAKLDQTRYEIE